MDQQQKKQQTLKELLDKKNEIEKVDQNTKEIEHDQQMDQQIFQVIGQNLGDNKFLYVPVNSNYEDRPIYVNPKQYLAILNRRRKKVQKKLMSENIVRIKNKIKYIKRSKHAKKRKRDKNGKFITKNKKDEQQYESEEDSKEFTESEFTEKTQKDIKSQRQIIKNLTFIQSFANYKKIDRNYIKYHLENFIYIFIIFTF